MKLKIGLLIVAMWLLASGCDGGGGGMAGAGIPPSGGAGAGGGGDPPAPGAGNDGGGPPAGPGPGGSTGGLTACIASGRGGVRGIWVGGVWPNESEEMRLLIAETGEFRWLPGDGWFQQVEGTFRVDGTNLSSTDAVWTWVDGLTYLETRSEPVDIWGGLDEHGGLAIQYQFNSDPSVTGTYTLTACDSVYRRESSLAILAGAYSDLYDNFSLAIDSQGAIFYQSQRTGCVGNGSIEVIDPEYNIYRAAIDVDNCTGQIAAAENGLTYTGLGYLGDSGDDTNTDTVEFALSAGTTGRVTWNLVARRQ